jgi:hypothetical protein
MFMKYNFRRVTYPFVRSEAQGARGTGKKRKEHSAKCIGGSRGVN